MIVAKIEKKQGEYILTVSGHAGYAPFGSDIVCAAVSVLVCAIGRFFDAHGELGAEVNISSGKALIKVKEYDYAPYVGAVFELISHGFGVIEESSPECFCLLSESL